RAVADHAARRDARVREERHGARVVRRSVRRSLRRHASLGRSSESQARERLGPRALLRDHLRRFAAMTPPSGNSNYPTAYRIGVGRIRELAAACAELGFTRPFVVTDPGIV